MKELLNKKLNILEVFLILGPFIDISTSVTERNFNLDFSVGILVRAFFIAFIVFYTFFISSYKYKKLSIIFIFGVFIYFLMYIANMYITKGISNILFEIKEAIKVFFFPLSLVGILNYIGTKKYETNPKLLFIIAIEYIFLLFVPAFFNIGYESYAQDKVGTIGWYFSGNEISAIYAILFVFIIFSYDYIKNKPFYFLLVLFSLYTVMLIGTKIPAIATLISIAGFITIKIIRYLMEKKKIDLKLVGISAMLMFLCVITFISSPVLKNYDIYKNYLISTREATDLVSAKPVEENIPKQEEKTTNFENIEENKKELPLPTENDSKLTSNEVATIIHSGRMKSMAEIGEKFKNTKILNKLLGMGKLDLEDAKQNLCEIDYIDILFNYGYLGIILYFSPLVIIVVNMLRKLNTNRVKEIIKNNEICCYFIALIIAFVLCAIAGHTLVAPSVSILISVILCFAYVRMKKGGMLI